MCLQWAKHSRFNETRRARWSRVIFQQARSVMSGNSNHEVAFRHLPASSSSSSILRVRVSSPPSFAIFQQHLKVFLLFEFAFRHLRALPSSSSIQQHLKALQPRGRNLSPFELAQNINPIMCDCILSNLQIKMLTTFMNVNFNKMLETLTFQQPHAQYLYSMHIHKQIIKGGGSSSEHYLTIRL